MAVPTDDVVRQLTWGDPEKVRYMAASIIESYDYLVNHATREDAWRRIMVLRDALRARQYAKELRESVREGPGSS